MKVIKATNDLGRYFQIHPEAKHSALLQHSAIDGKWAVWSLAYLSQSVMKGKNFWDA